jgi:hypothetical protein
MIKGTFRIGGENQEVIVKGNQLLFFDISSGTMTTIEGLRLSKIGSLKEFPDLRDDDEWKKKTIERFKKNMLKYNKEDEKLNYIKDELIKQGYEPLFFQKAGHRPKKW